MSAEARALARNVAALVRAAAAMVEHERQDCLATLPLLPPEERKRLVERHGMTDAWRGLASDAALDLERALRALDEEGR